MCVPLPVFHAGHRSSSGTPLSAEVTCWPHPAHVARLHVAHMLLRHILYRRATRKCRRLLVRVRG